MSNSAQLPFRQIQPGLGTTFGVDLANECQSGSLLPGSNIALGSSGVSSANVNPNLIQYATKALTATNIKNMYTTPVEVLAAPGTGLVYVINRVCLVFTATATQFANGGNVTLIYHTGAVAATGTICADTVINAATNSNSVGLGVAAAAVANDAIEITNATAPFITGTGTAVLHIWYSIITGV